MVVNIRDWLRGGAAFMAVVYLVGYLGAFLHTTMEVHVVCAEHGDLIHADDHHVHAETSSDRTELKAVNPHGDHHEHCALAQLLRSAQEGAEYSNVLVHSSHFEMATVLEPDTLTAPIRGPTIRLVLFAPKTSPPIA